MGVTGLWKLVEPSGKPVPLETLENKVLAIDISIWLHQVVKGFQDNKGNTLAHAHLLGLFHRLCKLLYYRIKPVFIFDGGVPQLKRETIAKRNQSKNKILTEADRLQSLLLQTLAKEKVVQQALGSTEDEIFKSPSKPKQPALLQKPDKDEMFKLPELPSEEREPSKASTSASSCTKFDMSTDSDSSLDEKNLRHAYSHNLQAVDVRSNEFKSLPADIRHEILTDIKETRKQSSWGRLHELPSESNEFSSFQMKRLLKRRQVQVSLEEAEKQMEGKSLTLSELRTFLNEEGVITAATSTGAGTSRQIASDENTRYLLVRDLKKAIEAATKKEEEEKIQSSQELKHNLADIKDEKYKENGGEDDEFDEDLQKAIQMSLECTDSHVYNDKDYECDEIKMNREQKRLLKDAAASLAKAYLIEYGGMNEDEIKEMLEQSQQNIQNDLDADVDSFNFKHNDKFILKGEMCSPYRHMKTLLKNSEEISTNIVNNSDVSITNKSKKQREELEKEIKPISDDIGFISSDSDDSDLVEVVEKIDPSPTKRVSEVDRKLQINIDLNGKFNNEDDIFADIFENTEKTKESLKLTDIRGNENDVKDRNTEKSSQHKTEMEVISSVPSIKEENLVIKENEQEIKNTQISNNTTEIETEQRKSLKSNPTDILDKLKKDLENVSKITLDDIDMKEDSLESIEKNVEIVEQKTDSHKEKPEIPKINLDDLEIDTKNEQSQSPSKSTEIIEILDDEDDTMSINKTPSKQKRKSISSFFETEYKIKRTPEKVEENDNELETTPKVKKPFFVRKTPGSSGRKRQEKSKNSDDEDDDESGDKISKHKKVSKMLFDDSNDNSNKNSNREQVIENVLETAAKLLKENKTEKELHSIATGIAKQKRELELERNRQDRMGTSITDKMSYECMQLLKLFGVPYIVAPMEAEAQCAFLDAANLTDGTITDDSDIWLFGGKTVYKNFFNQQKHVLEFRVENIEKLFNVDRKKLIQLAILVGSDYTTGVNGVGTVTALEILATFPPTPAKDGETSEIVSILSSLRKFREWWRNGKTIGPSGRTALRGKLKNIELIEGFPNLQIVEAYLNPKVDFSREKFSWGAPDVETIREFAKKQFGWTKIKTDEILQPVLKKLNEKKMQLSIKNYFKVESVLGGRELKVSKRVQKAIDKLSLDPNKTNETNEETEKPKKSRVRKTAKKTEAKSVEEHGDDDIEENQEQPKKKRRQNKVKKTTTSTTVTSDEEMVMQDNVASTSTTTVIPKSKPKLSNLLLVGAHETIPQKEKDAEEMRLRKEKAAEIFKKSETSKKQKKNVRK